MAIIIAGPTLNTTHFPIKAPKSAVKKKKRGLLRYHMASSLTPKKKKNQYARCVHIPNIGALQADSSASLYFPKHFQLASAGTLFYNRLIQSLTSGLFNLVGSKPAEIYP